MGLILGTLLCPVLAKGQALPPDVKNNHWAASSVQKALQNNVLTLKNGKFDGEGIVTHTQAVIALAKLAQTLEAGKWQAETSYVIPDKVMTTLQQGNWRQRPLTRYTLAQVLARFGEYFSNGVRRADPASKDRNKSTQLPPKPKVTLASSHPAYAAVTYLVNNHMLWSGSPLLKPGDKPIKGIEMSQAIAQVATGLTNLVTDLGLDEDGGTPDKSFKSKKP